VTERLTKQQHQQLVQIFKLLGEGGRLSIVLACINTPKAVCCLAEEAGMSQSLASHHLQSLKKARILKSERQGKQIIYSLDDEHIRHILTDMIVHVKEEHKTIK